MPKTFHEIPRVRPATPVLDRAATPSSCADWARRNSKSLPTNCARSCCTASAAPAEHFGAGLGVIELTIALHYVYDTPDDRLVWDVGHQAYPHKILTGRRERMGTLRQKDGLAAFRAGSSEYDTFGVGHSSTSISAALGMAVAARLKGEQRKSIAVIGDGALTAGMAFEALNHAPEVGANMLVVLNDNDMSISRNVGGLSNYLAKILQPHLFEHARRQQEDPRACQAPGKSPAAPRNTPRACWCPAPCSRNWAGTTSAPSTATTCRPDRHPCATCATSTARSSSMW